MSGILPDGQAYSSTEEENNHVPEVEDIGDVEIVKSQKRQVYSNLIGLISIVASSALFFINPVKPHLSPLIELDSTPTSNVIS